MAVFAAQVARSAVFRFGAVALAAWLGVAALAGSVGAQQAEGAKKAAQAPPAEPKRTFAAPVGQQRAAWVKICEKVPAARKGKDGKEEKKDVEICLTNHERLDANSGMTLVSASIRQVAGEGAQDFVVIVPLGMQLQPGLHIAIYSKDLWERAQKDEKIDQAKLKGIKLGYTLCNPTGCVAEAETTEEFMTDLKTSAGLVVFAVNSAGAPISLPVPLDGFEQALAGSPVDNKAYAESRKAIAQKIEQYQRDRAEQAKNKKAPAPDQKSAPGQAAPAAK
jgi:invasion protein IalB